jgi:hypothetical protein
MAVVAVMAPHAVKVAQKVETMAEVVVMVVVATEVDEVRVAVAASARHRANVNALTQKASHTQTTLLSMADQRQPMPWGPTHLVQTKARTAHRESVVGAVDEAVAVAANAPTTSSQVQQMSVVTRQLMTAMKHAALTAIATAIATRTKGFDLQLPTMERVRRQPLVKPTSATPTQQARSQHHALKVRSPAKDAHAKAANAAHALSALSRVRARSRRHRATRLSSRWRMTGPKRPANPTLPPRPKRLQHLQQAPRQARQTPPCQKHRLLLLRHLLPPPRW